MGGLDWQLRTNRKTVYKKTTTWLGSGIFFGKILLIQGLLKTIETIIILGQVRLSKG